MSWHRSDGNRLTLTLHIQPGAKRTEVAGLHGNALKIKLAAPPVDGKANATLLKFIAETFGVPLRQVMLKQGEKSRHKVVEIQQPAHGPDVLFAQSANSATDF